jgi:hypothetical protein
VSLEVWALAEVIAVIIVDTIGDALLDTPRQPRLSAGDALKIHHASTTGDRPNQGAGESVSSPHWPASF